MHTLLTSQQDDVFEHITAAGFDPREFEWTVWARAGEDTAQALRHSSGGFFEFRHYNQNRFGYCSPGRDTREQGIFPDGGSWKTLLLGVGVWLGWLEREISAPNLWGQLAIEGELMATPPALTENKAFTNEELTQIATRLEELKRYARQAYQLTPGQQEAVDARLDYLVDAASRTPRRDWHTLFVGTLVGLALDVVVPADAARGLLVVGLRSLGHLFGVDATLELPGAGSPSI